MLHTTEYNNIAIAFATDITAAAVNHERALLLVDSNSAMWETVYTARVMGCEAIMSASGRPMIIVNAA